ncbi:hypothetical protein EVB55_244 [Rhizobium phage RHph_Y68]|uniref:Uncharacterized protein n=1 Tax=Rhizobium phage RHph_Y68 TaxID=2509787 RepID=A0A7S5R9F1_9CAUD|nr:hypothetical protein PP934_gp244 [Rhizobium phage RHph_Y68]QIG68179.1 hypothetical protein EVB55_244 [Rhizobium phage RHph_Y68]
MGMNLYVAAKDLTGNLKVPEEFWEGLSAGEYVEKDDGDVYVPNPKHNPIFHVEMNQGNAMHIIEHVLELKIDGGMFDASLDDMIAKIALMSLEGKFEYGSYTQLKLKEILDLCLWGKANGCNQIYGA